MKLHKCENLNDAIGKKCIIYAPKINNGEEAVENLVSFKENIIETNKRIYNVSDIHEFTIKKEGRDRYIVRYNQLGVKDCSCKVWAYSEKEAKSRVVSKGIFAVEKIIE